MIGAIALAVWATVTAGVYLMLSRDALRCVLGLAVLGSGVNLLLFASGRHTSSQPPVVPSGALVLGEAANPLPQALVLTAIVIGFALACFSLALVLGLIQRARSEDVLSFRYVEPPHTDPLEPPLVEPEVDPALASAAGNPRAAGDRNGVRE